MNWFQNLNERALLIARNACIGAFIAVSLSGCVSDMGLDDLSSRAPELSSKMLAEMSKKGMAAESPVLIRIFKQESELEVWKQTKTGQYVLVKTYPMCRWSGKLGPKTRDGDRQAPEGFYHVSAPMLNPKSQFYLSFNLGYPNRLESALGYTGEALMVHGACSSSGCYALTDQGVGEIYALAERSLAAGQERFQVQAYPWACRKHFWRQLSPSQGRYFHALLTFCSPKRRASKSFWSLTVQPPEKPKPFRSHSIASKPAMVRRAVLKDWKPPIFGMFFFTRKWSLSIPCWRCLVT